MFEFSVSKDMKYQNKINNKGRIPAHLIVKELKFSVEQGRVVTTFDIIKH